MIAELPFWFRVSGSDAVHGVRAISTSFRFHGWLRLEGSQLHIAWRGQARVQNVGLFGARDERLPLPAESLIVPLTRLRRAELAGGWWRPRVVISAGDVQALSLVPSEDQGQVAFWYARRDRALAAALADALQRGIAARPESVEGADGVVHLSDSTPATPPDNPSW